MRVFTRFSLKNTLVIFLVVVMLIIGGIYSTSSVKTELMPDITYPVVSIITVYPGAAPGDVAESISRPIYKAISGIKGLKTVNMSSNENISLLITQFGFSKDMEKAEREIQDALNKVKLPDKAQKPTLSRFAYNSIPILQYTITADKQDEAALLKFINDTVQPAITGVNGVGSASVSGIEDKSIFIKADEKKLKENNLTLQDIQQALAANDINYPMGTVNIDGKTLPVKVNREITNINDIKSIPLIVAPNTAELMGDSMGKITEAIGGVYAAMGEMGNGMSQLGKGMGDMGQMLGTNMQAVALLDSIQKNQSVILAQKELLNNPDTTADVKAKAQQEIAVATQTIAVSQKMLDEIMSKAMKGMKPDQQAQRGSMNTPMGVMPDMSKSGDAEKTGENTLKLTTVSLGEIAGVSFEKPDGMSHTRANMKTTVIMSIVKNDDANAVQVAADVEAKVEDLNNSNPGFNIDKISDTSEMITESVNGMVKEGLLGALFAIIIIALFLRDIRATVIAVISIPLSVLIALILLPRFDISLNIMSLSGMAVAIGRIVDDSIVVIENIYRRLQKRISGSGDIIEDATAEVSSAITSSTITTVAVFLPLGLVEGFVGKIFASFALTVVICILASLLVAVTVVPVMGRFMLLKKPPKHKEGKSRIDAAYKKVLSFALSHRVLVVLTAVVLMVSSFAMLFWRVETQFMPDDKSKAINAKLNMPAGTELDLTNAEVAKFEEYLTKNSDVDVVTSMVGDTGGDAAAWGMIQGTNQASLYILLKDGADPDRVLDTVREKAKFLENDKVKWIVTPQSNYGTQENLEVLVYGENVEDLKTAADKITAEIKGVNGLSNISNNLSDKKPEISIKVDSKKAADKGLNPMFVAGLVRSALNYDKVTSVENNGKTVDVMLGINSSKLDSLEKVKNLEIRGMAGTTLLKDVALVEITDGPVSISERDGKQFASISADIISSNTAKVAQEVTDRIEGIETQFKPGVTYRVGGSVDDMNSTFKDMGMAMLIAIFLVFITMVITFKEGTAPLAILFSLPFAAVGALLALVITGHSLSISGLVGILMLIGIVVTNAIVLVDRVQTNRVKGMGIREALLEAGTVRLRPIIMTAAATVMALIPLALGFSEGAIISEELGIVVIGGLTLSTVLTLVIVPVAYSLLEGLKERITKGSVVDGTITEV